MTTRRKFFQVLGLGAAVAAGGKASIAAALPKSENKAITDKLETQNHNGALHFHSEYYDEADAWKQKQYIDANPFLGTVAPGIKLKAVSVDVKPGPDGELYLKSNGKWRKIVTE